MQAKLSLWWPFRLAGWAALVLMLAALWLVYSVGPDVHLGYSQKIFYFHVGTAWNAFLAFFVTFVYSVLYLIRRNRRFDNMARAAAEVGLLFTTLVLITGSIWGRSAWNTWWSWEPRLTTTLVLWFIYFVYAMLRGSELSWERKALICAVIGIVGFVDVPIVFVSVTWWQSLHPVVLGPEGGGVSPAMVPPMLTSFLAFTALFFYFWGLRSAIEHTQVRLIQLRERIENEATPPATGHLPSAPRS